ncbi:hypothetical protein ACOCEA_12985 [Maribacter sp. CXY002]|uniref:hypothetical protein n=1 Tax=Maribacter luteocoastalis TaxID=3407671 RepID=UPI003B677F1C
MKQNYLRRNFLKNSLIASGGLILFPTIASASNSGLRTEIGISHQTDIRRNLFGKQLEITGQIFDVTGNNTLRGVKVEFWHLSPNSEIIEYRGEMFTDINGRYLLKTDYPSRSIGKAATIHFKISKDYGQFETELKISEFGANITGEHWEANNHIGNDLLFPKMDKALYKTKINFNFSLKK